MASRNKKTLAAKPFPFMWLLLGHCNVGIFVRYILKLRRNTNKIRTWSPLCYAHFSQAKKRALLFYRSRRALEKNIPTISVSYRFSEREVRDYFVRFLKGQRFLQCFINVLRHQFEEITKVCLLQNQWTVLEWIAALAIQFSSSV